MELMGTNSNGDGVIGTSANGGAGVRGIANGANHDGVVGQSTARGNGVLGVAANGDGVFGQTANGGAGVRGIANGANHDGVVGQSTASGNGVLGVAANGDGVFGQTANGGAGVRGIANGANHDGVVGQSTGPGNGVLGWAENGAGVLAVSRGGGHGVVATALAGDGLNATSQGGGHGVSGLVAYGDGSKIGNGIEGLVGSGTGVLGTSSSASVIGLVNPGGWHPETGLPNSSWSIGVCGAFQSGFPNSPGLAAPLPWDIHFVTERVGSFSHFGVYGLANVGVLAATPFNGGFGLLACNTDGGKAAAFMGDVDFIGNIELSGQINTTGQDCAEYFEIASSSTQEAGTVMVAGGDGQLLESSTAYDQKVVGVISGGGSHWPGIVLGVGRKNGVREAAIALVGRVMCKVDADYGPVEIGDLLTTSQTAGHAMKVADSERAFGCILGKALGSLPQGRGLVPILAALK